MNEWVVAATVIDRICFMCIIAFFIVVTFAFIIVFTLPESRVARQG